MAATQLTSSLFKRGLRFKSAFKQKTRKCPKLKTVQEQKWFNAGSCGFWFFSLNPKSFFLLTFTSGIKTLASQQTDKFFSIVVSFTYDNLYFDTNQITTAVV